MAALRVGETKDVVHRHERSLTWTLELQEFRKLSDAERYTLYAPQVGLNVFEMSFSCQRGNSSNMIGFYLHHHDIENSVDASDTMPLDLSATSKLLLVLQYCWKRPLGLPRSLDSHVAMIKMTYCNPKLADIRFTFASSRRVLYAQSDLLRTVDYFKTLLDSDMNGSNNQPGDHSIPDDDSDLSDSEDDPDQAPPAKRARVASSRYRTSEQAVRERTLIYAVHVVDFSPITWATLLFWLSSRDCLYAPLSSAYDVAKAAGQTNKSRRAWNKERAIFVPMADQLANIRPPSASPKSLVRLCDKLQSPALDPVKAGALAAIKRSLTPANVTQEVFSPASSRHPELRTIFVAFLSENLAAIDEATLKQTIDGSKMLQLLPDVLIALISQIKSVKK